MGIFFSGRELVNVAVGIEQNGAAFYDSLAGSAKEANVKSTYKYLADQEREHLKTFQGMLASVGDYQPPETLTDDYAHYVKALIDTSVFTSDQTAREVMKRASSNREAVEIGIGAEKDSIMFYSEMRDLIRPQDREVVERIINEERSHLVELLRLKRGLSR